jgi:hypothetical protein
LLEYQECIETRNGAPARRPGMKEVTVGSRSGFVCKLWDSVFQVSCQLQPKSRKKKKKKKKGLERQVLYLNPE